MPDPKPALITIPMEPIGSIPRPPDLLRNLSQVDNGDPALGPLYEDAIRDTIERFVATRSRIDTSTGRDTTFAKIEARVRGTELAEKIIGARGS